MNFRSEEVLSWIMPGFYLLFCGLGFFALIFHADNCIDSLKNMAGIVKDFLAVVIFAIPLFSFVLGWIVNAAGGFLFQSEYMRWPSYKSHDMVYTADEANSSENSLTWHDKVARYSKYRKEIKPEKVDRFYYRFVFSRNMVATQLIIFILTLTAPLYSDFQFSWSMAIISLAVLALYLAIAWRDLHTHAIYVFKEAKTCQTDPQ